MKATIKIEGQEFSLMPDLQQNDVGQILNFIIRQFNDDLVDLSGGAVQFKMKQINVTTNKVDATCTLAGDPTTGQCSYTTLSGDLNTNGVFDGELEVTIGTTITTIPIGRFKIQSDLPN